jgi:hypothetical protein
VVDAGGHVHVLEVGVDQGLLGRDALGRVVHQHFLWRDGGGGGVWGAECAERVRQGQGQRKGRSPDHSLTLSTTQPGAPTCSRSSPSASSVGSVFRSPSPVHMGKLGLKSGRAESPGHVVSVGVPRMRKILKISSISESPGKRGMRETISAKMQPTLHMSTAAE